MSITTQNSRIALHRSSTTTDVPTIPASADFTDGTWIYTDIAKGEVMINMADDKIWFRSDNGIIEIYEAANHLTPDASGQYDLGTASRLFRNLYLINNAVVGVNHTVNSSQSLVVGEEVTLNAAHDNTIAVSGRGPTGAAGLTTLYVSTSDATPTNLEIYAGVNGFAIETGMSYRMDVRVLACDSSGNAKEWDTSLLIKNIGGTTSFVGSPTVNSTFADVALTTATIAVNANNTNDRLDIEVTGIAATGINWTAELRWTRTAKV